MKFVFKARALDDLEWLERYYTEIFPDGSSRAERQFFKTKGILKDFPDIGRSVKNKNQREYIVPGIPFSFIYRRKSDRIEILRILDLRSNRPNKK
jgi:plasmid stabilization system protein ParE